MPPAPQASAAVEPTDTDKPPPPPSSYGGPSIIAMLSDVVWFSNGRKLKGSLEIDFYSSDDLDRILVILGLAGSL